MSTPNELSFLPEDYLLKKARRRANILCGALSVVVMGTIGSAFAISERSMRGLDAELAQVEERYNQVSEQIKNVQAMHAKQRQIVQHAELATSLVEKVPRSRVLATVTNSLPAGVSLLDFAMESKVVQAAAPSGATAFDARVAAAAAAKKAATPEAPKYDVFIKLSGVADNDGQVGEYISKLQASPLLKDVNLVISDNFAKDKSSLRRFQLEMLINPAADVNVIDKSDEK
jgi:Tfp pilus assembly protein PilN